MAKRVKIWFDAEGDYLEVRFSSAPGYMRQTKNDAIMKRVDKQGNVLGFSLMNVGRSAKEKPLVAELISKAGEEAFASSRDIIERSVRSNIDLLHRKVED